MVIQNEVIKSTTKFDSYFDDGKNGQAPKPNDGNGAQLNNALHTPPRTSASTPEELLTKPNPVIDEDDVNFI